MRHSIAGQSIVRNEDSSDQECGIEEERIQWFKNTIDVNGKVFLISLVQELE